MSRAALIAIAIAPLGALMLTAAAAPADIVRPDMPGRQVFERQCAPCHGTGPGADGAPMLPGTAALAAKYDGAKPGALELRSDLPAPVLRLFVRRGVSEMPPFRKSEITDAQIDEVAAYLAATAAAN
ncbi:c-type cytochrome [Aurantiacibacter flavus]|uniref:Cytochrome c n=1 Tax=Aurantiacibacter flavus TaxID=3145232 RepID=A0ABV0D072_9SPHN